MRKSRAAITGVHGYVPPDVLSNAELAKMVDTSDEWIVERTGIKERRILKGKGLGTSHMGAQAVEALLAKTATSPEEIDLLICATTTPDFVFPSTANLICEMCGIRSVGSFDVQAACSGFIYALTIGAQFIENGKSRKIVVVGADKMSAIIDYTDRATCVLFGDGAGAMLVEPVEDGENAGFIDFLGEVDGSGGEFLYMPAGGSRLPASHETVEKRQHFVHQEGQQVFKYASRKMFEVSRELLRRNNMTVDDVGIMIPHQANLRIITAATERLGLPREKVLINIDRYGNTTAGTVPLATRDAIEQGRLKKGDVVLFAAVGAGYTVGASLWRWAY